jgi:acylphosphatase
MPQCCYYISGRVQGVWFRESTRRKALELGLTGSAENLADGRVRVLAEGPTAPLAELERWLQHGPPLATVQVVQSEPVEFDSPDSFTTA